MLLSLKDTVLEPSGTKAAIRQALMSPAGLRVVWVIVEAEEDVAVYEKFMRPDSTVVKTSEGSTGRKGHANVESIVREIKEEVPVTHIMGIRDADYSRYKEGYKLPVNIFLTDHRDLEMTLLEADSVKQALRSWTPDYDAALAKCIPVCRHFGYLRIYNDVADLSVVFHKNLSPTKYWDFNQHCIVEGWELDSTSKFLALAGDKCTAEDVSAFITTHSLEQESFYDICRGHDLLKLLSQALVHLQYKEENIMAKIIEEYSFDDFKTTRLYASILVWQNEEGVSALVA